MSLRKYKIIDLTILCIIGLIVEGLGIYVFNKMINATIISTAVSLLIILVILFNLSSCVFVLDDAFGSLVEDVIAGRATVEGSELTYTRNSFIISQSASDGYHPNMLSGYLTSLMAYCAVTGESAVGQPYAFCTDSTVESAFNADTYVTKYYKNGATTNMKEIFASETDMAGLQALADQYL